MGFVEAYATLSAAIETAKLVAAGSAALSTAELQMRVNEITNALWTANNSLHEAQQEIRERDAEIARLNEALEFAGGSLEPVTPTTWRIREASQIAPRSVNAAGKSTTDS